MKLYALALRSLTVGTALGLLGGFAPRLLAGDSSHPKEKPGLTAAGHHSTDEQAARRLIGQEVKTPAGESLGQVKDLVIETGKGRIVYALVGSGGLLGVGEKIHAIPFAALQPAAKGDFVLNVERANWDNLSVIRENELDQLAEESRSRPLFEQFGLKWSDEMHHGRGLLASITSRNDPIRLVRASQLDGRHVINAGQEVGEIEQVLVNAPSHRASVLLDPNDDYTGTNHKFVLGFDQLTPSLDAQDRLSTPLTRADFARATPLREEWWMVAGGYPYIWSGEGAITAPGAASARAADAALTQAGNAARPSVTLVRGALMSDEDLRAAAKNVMIESEGDTLVLSGPVPSERFKKKIGQKIAEAAPGWHIDDRLSISSPAE